MRKKTKTDKILVKVRLIKEVYELHTQGTDKKDYQVRVKISPEHIEIDDEFVFKSKNTKETIKRWENIVNLLGGTVQFLKNKQKYG